MSYSIRIKTLTPQRFVALRSTTLRENLSSTLSRLFEEMWAFLNRQESVTIGPAIARYHSYSDLVDVEAGFPVNEVIEAPPPFLCGELPAGQAATTIHTGRYDGLVAAHAAVQDWLAENGRAPAGAPWEIYWVDPSHVESPLELRTEVVWPIR